ncbi:mortality factor 4 protein 1-like [Tropilaelaps mercedesae]|uniref:Mortality factor 4 protein 1-like n=1 Tax=Tropilaelaps mercedesae TaxID=418985 RepID=A0A1V9XQQ3_9ACAR|nr:mortality factor 4 protein 1-like [Tropilaelaps mercedesae]
MAPALKFKFQENEKVLCFHGPSLYDAKCIKAQVKDKTNHYFVHYLGWNNKWDEWVPENRVLKVNEANLAKQAELTAAQQKARKETGKKTKKQESSVVIATKETNEKDNSKRESTTGVGKDNAGSGGSNKTSKSAQESKKDKLVPTTGGKKREVPATTGGKDKSSTVSSNLTEEPKKKKVKTEVGQTDREEPHYTQKVEIHIKIPDDLKDRLADDWDFICRQKKIVKLPCEYTVDKVLEEYLTQKVSVKGTTPCKESIVAEFTAGLRCYFNSMLGKHLLYKFERPQYAQLLEEHGDKQMSQHYGAVHLLRMFTLLGRFLSYTALDERSVQLLLSHLHDFLRFLCRNTQFCDRSEYMIAPPDYHRRAM